MTFTGEPRDHHVYEHAHESPWLMTVPLVVLAVCSVVRRLGLAAVGRRRRACWSSTSTTPSPTSVHGRLRPRSRTRRIWKGGRLRRRSATASATVARDMHRHGRRPGPGRWSRWASCSRRCSTTTACSTRPRRKEQFPAVHAFLTHKWYFDELYSAMVVRPALVVAHWFRCVRPDCDRRRDPLPWPVRRCGCRSGTAGSTTASSTAWSTWWATVGLRRRRLAAQRADRLPAQLRAVPGAGGGRHLRAADVLRDAGVGGLSSRKPA